MGPDPGDRSAYRGVAQVRSTIKQRASAGHQKTGFDRFDLRPELQRAIRDADFQDPRPIQKDTLPAALEGRDVLGLAPTGTGKTAAFALPILQRLLEGRRPGPRALVVTPTRELASQVSSQFELLAKHTQVRSLAIFGGVPMGKQLRALKSRPEVLVACPGRLLDLLSQGAVRLNNIEVLVLDEADHMFDMGFLPDLRRILNALPERRQNLLFSATMPREIRGLADRVLHRPKVIELGRSQPAKTIDHALYPLDEAEKVSALEGVLDRKDFHSAIVFLRTKRRATRLAKRLADRGHSAVALQGNMSQPQRERALKGFKDGKFKVMVATDIAARGLDIEAVSHVVNYDVPNTPDAYTHRIGRTGRSERSGIALTFITPHDRDAVNAIEKRLGSRIERRRASEFGKLERAPLQATKGAQGGSGRRGPGRGGSGSPGRGPAGRRGPNGAGPNKKKAGTKRAKAKRRMVEALGSPVRSGAAAEGGGPAFGSGVFESKRGAGSRQTERPEARGREGRPKRRRRD